MKGWLVPAAFLLLGLLQMVGDVLGLDAVKGLGSLTGASPAPKVFSAVQGLETYSTRFFVEWESVAGQAQSIELTPEAYSRLRGPYNRRNVFGAAVAYGPLLDRDPRTRGMFRQVARYALCGDALLLRELGVEETPREGTVRVRLEPLDSADLGDLPRIMEAPCQSP